MDNATFTDNIFSDINYYGVRVEWSSDNTFTNNTFARSFYRTLTIISLSGRIGTPRRIASDARIPGKGGNNTFTGNTFSGTGSAMLLHRQANNTTITGNNFKDNGPTHIALTPVTGTIIDSNWYDASPAPQDANPLVSEIGGVTPPANALRTAPRSSNPEAPPATGCTGSTQARPAILFKPIVI